MAPGRVMAIDYGTKRVGIAISDELRMLASARGIIENSPKLLDQVVAKAISEQVRMVVLGLPKSLKNEDSEMTLQVRKFGEVLKARLEQENIGFELRDERLTSLMANANIAMSDLGKKKKENKALRDEEAARILLQEYLDQR